MTSLRKSAMQQAQTCPLSTSSSELQSKAGMLTNSHSAIAENGSIEASAACITSPSGGVIASVLGIPEKDFGNVKVLQARAFLIGESKEVNDITYEILEAMLQSGKLIPNRVKVLPGGLRAVKEGWELGREHKVPAYSVCLLRDLIWLQISGEKFVYRIAETQF